MAHRSRAAIAAVVATAALAAEVWLLMQEDTTYWRLIALASVAGILVGGICWRKRGAVIGLVVGSALGVAAPFLYFPFWMAFTLPPHPALDF